MDTDRAARLAALEARAAELDAPDIGSPEELQRFETARAARHFGFAQPSFRTSLRLRFTGEGVKGHDLRGSIAGEVVGGISATVEAAAGDKKVALQDAELFLSPTVLPGSTVLELFSKPPDSSDQERLDTDIDDTPADVAIKHLFSLLDTVNSLPVGHMSESDIEVGTRFGQKLFALSNSLIESEIDLELSWTRPRGITRAANFSRNTASGFRAILDHETTRREDFTEVGTLTDISTDGTIRFSFGTRSVTVDGSNLGAEVLRGLWASRVVLSWTEVTVSHARRAQASTERKASAIRLASD
jgi:hypothetical protein